MPVRRSKDPMDGGDDPVLPPGDPRLVERMTRLWALSALLAPPHHAKGVQRFRSVEEAGEAREQEILERMRDLRRSRKLCSPP